MKFKKKIVFTPAWDKTNPDPKKNYGIHDAGIKFYLIGEKGVIQFILSTRWYLPHNQKKLDDGFYSEAKNYGLEKTLEWNYRPNAYDIGYHSAVPMYEGQSKMDNCEFFEDGCYYDGSSLNAEKYLAILIEGGTKALWKAMKKVYHSRFEDDPKNVTIEDANIGELLNALCASSDNKDESCEPK